MRKSLTGLVVGAAVLTGIFSAGALRHAGGSPAGASVPSAIEIADRALTSPAAGIEDEGSYALIDPIGPGGVKSLEATDEVYASTLQAGKYHAWASYRDPFAPQPGGPPGSTSPYKPGGGGREGHRQGGAR